MIRSPGDSYVVPRARLRTVARSVLTCGMCGHAQMVTTVEADDEVFLDPPWCPECKTEWMEDEAE